MSPHKQAIILLNSVGCLQDEALVIDHLGIILLKPKDESPRKASEELPVDESLTEETRVCWGLEDFVISTKSWMMPGGVSCFSLSLDFFDSMATTWVIEGRRLAAACVQKRATFMNLRTSTSGYCCSCRSTSSSSLPS